MGKGVQAQVECNLSKLEKLSHKLKEARYAVGTAVADIEDAAFFLATRCSEDEQRKEIARYLYWKVPEVEVAFIAKILRSGCKGKQVPYLLGPAEVGKRTCSECGNIFPLFANSRSDKARVLHESKYNTQRKPKPILCQECQERRDEDEERANNEHNARLDEEDRLAKARIQELKSMTYSSYLETDHWNSIRVWVLKKAKFRCQLCNNQGEMHVHHRTYENRGNEQWGDLIVLCRSCHATFHGVTGEPKR
jgi:5-methylcytosine-specific restriction endonuclease McrA